LYMRMSTFHVKLHCKSEVSTKYNIKLYINCTSTLNGFFVYEDADSKVSDIFEASINRNMFSKGQLYNQNRVSTHFWSQKYRIIGIFCIIYRFWKKYIWRVDVQFIHNFIFYLVDTSDLQCSLTWKVDILIYKTKHWE
jgi:hypothetical protein